MELGDGQYKFHQLGQREDSGSGDDYVDELDSTRNDARDMQRLGRKQELRRNFRSLSMLSFTIIVQATWEFVLVLVFGVWIGVQLLMRIQIPDSGLDWRWTRGNDLVVCMDHVRLHANRRQSRRDGFNGSNIGRTGAFPLCPIMPPS